MQAIRDLECARQPSDDECFRARATAHACFPQWYATTAACALGCPRAALHFMRIWEPLSEGGMCTAALRGFEDVICAAGTFRGDRHLPGARQQYTVADDKVVLIRDVPEAEYRAAVAACRRWAPRSARRAWITAFASGGGGAIG